MKREPLERQGAENSAFASIEDAVAAMARGEIIVVVDDEDRENEGDLIMAAEAATPEAITFFVRHTSGVICAPLTGDRLDELDIPLDGAGQHRVAPHGLHLLGGLRARHLDRHLGGRPGDHDPCADRSRDPSGGSRPSGAHLPAALQRGGRAQAGRPHRGRGRPGPAGRDGSRGCAVRDRERRRHHGQGSRPDRVLRGARPPDGHDRPTDQVPPPEREAGPSRRRGADPHAVGRLHLATSTNPCSTASSTWRWSGERCRASRTSW